MSTIAGVQMLVKHSGLVLGSDDVALSYLPLAHIFDRYDPTPPITYAQKRGKP